jgi:hypothetical protein
MPTLAVLPTSGSTIVADAITGADTALPISAVFNSSISACLIGDVDGSGVIDIADVGVFVDVLLGGTMDSDQACRADTNEDQQLDGNDVFGFVQSLIGN